MKKIVQKGFAHAGIFVAVAVVAISGVLVWVYLSKSSQLAANTNTPQIKTTAQAVSGARQVKQDLANINIDKSIDTSEIDAVLR